MNFPLPQRSKDPRKKKKRTNEPILFTDPKKEEDK